VTFDIIVHAMSLTRSIFFITDGFAVDYSKIMFNV